MTKNIQAEHDRIIDAVGALWDITREEMRGPRRYSTTVLSRQVAMFLIRKRCQASLVRIGLLFGNRDHTTVHAGIDRITGKMAEDPELAKRVAAIEASLDAPSAESSPQVRDTISANDVTPAMPVEAGSHE